MKKRLLACSVLLMAGLSQTANAQLALENFNSLTAAGQLPPNWVMINDGHTVSSSFTGSASTQAGLTANAFIPVALSSSKPTEMSMLTTSYFSPAATADRWLITPSFTVTSDKMILTWQDYNLGSNDKMQVWVSTTAGTTAASFTTKLYDAVPGTSSALTTHAVSLSAYNSQTIRIAFRNNMAPYTTGSGNWGWVMDNVQTQVLPNKIDGAITSIAPVEGYPLAYGTVGSKVTFSGVVKNNGASTMNNFTVNYQQGANPVQSFPVTGANVGPLGSYKFTHSIQYTIPSVGSFPVKVSLALTGDEVASNDAMNTTVVGVSTMPKKRLTIEEATGTWCGYCVRGIVYMDSMQTAHPKDVSLIAVHNGDPMVVSSYDSWMGSNISGYPSVVIDRRETADPSQIFSVYNAESNYFGFADMTLGTPTKTSTSYSLPVKITPATPLTGDYRLVLVMTENQVHGTGSTWDQHNYYSNSRGANDAGTMKGSSYDFDALGDPVPGSQIKYDFVARSASPSVTGTANSLASPMAAGTTYNATVTATLDPSWNVNNLSAVVLLINGANGIVMNSVNRTVSNVGVTNVSAGLAGLSVTPNPAKNVAAVTFTLAQSSAVQVQVVDAIGRTVSTQNASFGAGAQSVNINVSDFAAGVYNVIVRTEAGNVSQRLSVVK